MAHAGIGGLGLRSLAIFGATGSVGTAALDLVRAGEGTYGVHTLTAGRNSAAMIALAHEFSPKTIVMADPKAAAEVRAEIDSCQVLAGEAGLIEAAQGEYDLHIASIVGIAGLAPTFAALQTGRDVALANKEALVCAGSLMMSEAKAKGARLLPVDSEHNAIFQCFEAVERDQIVSVQLTGSGGPFRGWTAAQIANATLDQALKHPNWSMGPKITIDSATLMNKALEVIEARWLFDLKPEQVEVVIHPQSIVHSAVTYADGSILAQLGSPDMRTPLAYTMAYPKRAANGGTPLRLTDLRGLTFEQPDEIAFPTLGYARHALESQSLSASIALNSANEVLNEAVREQLIPFGALMPMLGDVLDAIDMQDIRGLADIRAFDEEVRRKAMALLQRKAR